MLLKSPETQTDKVDQARKKLKVIRGIFTTRVPRVKADLNSSYLSSGGTSIPDGFPDFTYVVKLFSGEVEKVTLFALA